MASARHLLRALLCAFVCLIWAAPASAAGVTIVGDPLYPAAGDTLTFEAPSQDCAFSWVFSVDGVQRPSQTDRTITATFNTAGSHTVSVVGTKTNNFGCPTPVNYDVTFSLLPALAGQILVDPEPALKGVAVQLEATQTGGKSGYTYAWDSDNDGQFDDSTSRIITKTYPANGSQTVRVRITDSASPAHETVTTKTFSVVTPTPTPTPTPLPPGQTPSPTPVPTATPTPLPPDVTPAPETPAPTPAPPACQREVAFGLAQFTTTGCFTQKPGSNPAVWTTRASVNLNGITFKDYGQTFTITTPKDATKDAGRFTAPDSTINFLGQQFYSGDIDWEIPAAKQGEEKDLTSFTVFAGTKVYGLNVSGTVRLRLGWRASGRYATIPMRIAFPSSFKSGPYEGAGSVTGEAAALATPEGGVSFGGLKLTAENAWIGKLKVLNACLSYVPGGSQAVSTCNEKIGGDKEPYLKCNSDPTVDRWDGSASVELPTSGVQFGVFGGLSGGQLANLGGYVNNLGNKVPIASGVYLNKIGLGICVQPPPVTIKGEIGVAVFPFAKGDTSLLGINGTFIYTDGQYPAGWTMEIGGNVTLYDLTLGTANVKFGPTIPWEFDVKAGLNVYGLASIEGQISGWVDAPTNQFNIGGSVRGCVFGELCASASGLVSSTGVAGCVDAGSTEDSYLQILLEPPYVRFVTRTTRWQLGFGYVWNTGQFDVLGNSCNFSPYSTARPPLRSARAARAAQAAGEVSTSVPKGTQAITLRYSGTNGAPDLVLAGPDGTSITTPTDRKTAQVEGKYTLVRDTKNGTTNVMLINPAAGTWTATAAPGASSTPTKAEQALLEAPPTLDARVEGKGERRTVKLVYAAPDDASVKLVELGKGVSRVIAKSVKARGCGFGPKDRPGTDQKIKCATVKFKPSPGPGGKRTIQAIVTRDGQPLSEQDVTTFTAPKLVLPSKLGTVRAKRTKGDLVFTFPKAKGASTLNVAVTLSDGRMLSYDLKPKCGGLRIKKVPVGVSAKFTAVGVRYDLVTGKKRTFSISKKQKSAGPKGAVAKAQRGRVCS